MTGWEWWSSVGSTIVFPIFIVIWWLVAYRLYMCISYFDGHHFHELLLLLLSTPNEDRAQDGFMDGNRAPIRLDIPPSVPATYNLKEDVFNRICSSRPTSYYSITNHNPWSVPRG